MLAKAAGYPGSESGPFPGLQWCPMDRLRRWMLALPAVGTYDCSAVDYCLLLCAAAAVYGICMAFILLEYYTAFRLVSVRML